MTDTETPTRQVSDPVPTTVRELIATFETLLRDVRFPNVDLSVLEALAGELRERHAAVERIRGELSAAQEALAESHDVLRRRALTALAYAKVYAGDDPTLTEHLSGIGLGRAAGRAGHDKKVGGRRARRKATTEGPGGVTPVAELPFSRDSVEAEDAVPPAARARG